MCSQQPFAPLCSNDPARCAICDIERTAQKSDADGCPGKGRDLGSVVHPALLTLDREMRQRQKRFNGSLRPISWSRIVVAGRNGDVAQNTVDAHRALP
jgi:hypothetical protein